MATQKKDSPKEQETKTPEPKNRFTEIIHKRGWKVQDACAYWGIRLATYNARIHNPAKHNELECMCEGLPRYMQTEPLNDN